MPDHEILSPFPGSRLPHVGTYRRVLPVSLDRMYENALDWEHLPWVHRSSFSRIECLEAGNWGWRARIWSSRGDESVIELRLDRACRRWITRTLEGRNRGSEIWTHAFPLGPSRVDIVVDFFVPGVEPGAREKAGRAFAALYRTLYDEDVAMMVERQQQLDHRVEGARRGGGRDGGSVDDASTVLLGRRSELVLPLVTELAGRRFVVNECRGELVVYPALCPHQLGPLTDAPLEDGIVTCPWHGYRFDVVSGACLSGQTCRLVAIPALEVRDGQVLLSARH